MATFGDMVRPISLSLVLLDRKEPSLGGVTQEFNVGKMRVQQRGNFLVEQLPRRIQTNLGGAPSKTLISMKSLSLETRT